MHQRLEAEGWQRVSATQATVLHHLAHGAERPVEVARAIGLTRQSVQQAVAPLVSRGWVLAAPDPSDTRGVLLSLGPDGRRWRAAHAKHSKAVERVLAKRIGPSALESLRAALTADRGAAPLS